METAVTYLCNSLILISLAYFSIGFVLHLVDRWNQIDLTKPAKAIAPQLQPSLPAATVTPVKMQLPKKRTVPAEVGVR
ncbi:MAG: hypothetical protein Kow00121_51340 [Elainellaceae cyanobacterium]